MRHLAWFAGCVLVVSCTVNSSNLNVDAGGTGAGGHVVVGTGGGSGGTNASGGAGGDACPRCVPTGGTIGSGGQIATGGTTGTGGQTATGGVTGSGGQTATGGVTGTGGQIGAGGQAATGGTTGTGGQAATGGTTGTGGQIATGGTTGTGGQSATGGQSGTGGQAGAGGSTGHTCAQLATEYTSALMAAKACTPGAPDQCKQTANSTIGCTGCPVYVNDATQLQALKAEWTNDGCAQSQGPCPAIACIAPVPATCTWSNSGPGNNNGMCSPN